MRQELIDKLINHQKIMDDECFELSIEISRLLNTNDESKQSDGRELIIRVLDNWNNISDSYKNIFTDLVSSAGFYPYIHKLGLKLADFSDEIRMSYHQSNNLENRYFHSEQKNFPITSPETPSRSWGRWEMDSLRRGRRCSSSEEESESRRC